MFGRQTIVSTHLGAQLMSEAPTGKKKRKPKRAKKQSNKTELPADTSKAIVINTAPSTTPKKPSVRNAAAVVRRKYEINT